LLHYLLLFAVEFERVLFLQFVVVVFVVVLNNVDDIDEDLY